MYASWISNSVCCDAVWHLLFLFWFFSNGEIMTVKYHDQRFNSFFCSIQFSLWLISFYNIRTHAQWTTVCAIHKMWQFLCSLLNHQPFHFKIPYEQKAQINHKHIATIAKSGSSSSSSRSNPFTVTATIVTTKTPFNIVRLLEVFWI